MLEPRHTEYWLRQPRFPVTVLRSLIEVILLSFAQLHRAKFFVLSNESHCFTFNSCLDLALKIGVAFSFSREALSCSRDDYDHAQRLSDWREVRPVLVDGERDPKIHNLFKIAAVESSEICWMNADIFNHIDAGEIPI